jgi:hypothetical protein
MGCGASTQQGPQQSLDLRVAPSNGKYDVTETSSCSSSEGATGNDSKSRVVASVNIAADSGSAGEWTGVVEQPAELPLPSQPPAGSQPTAKLPELEIELDSDSPVDQQRRLQVEEQLPETEGQESPGSPGVRRRKQQKQRGKDDSEVREAEDGQQDGDAGRERQRQQDERRRRRRERRQRREGGQGADEDEREGHDRVDDEGEDENHPDLGEERVKLQPALLDGVMKWKKGEIIGQGAFGKVRTTAAPLTPSSKVVLPLTCVRVSSQRCTSASTSYRAC